MLSTLTALLLLGCSGDDRSKSETAPAAPVEKAAPAAPAAPAQTAPAETPAPVTEAAPEAAAAPAESVEAAAEAVKTEVETAAQAVEAEVAAAAEAPMAVDGAMLFKQKCATCHGQSAEKKALNASQIIAGWDKAKLLEALHGYKDGSYGAAMKGMMQGQVKALSDADMDALADHISSL